MKCALTAQNLLSLQQLSFIYRPLIGWPCVNTHMVPAHECTHQQSTDPSPRSIFSPPPPSPSQQMIQCGGYKLLFRHWKSRLQSPTVPVPHHRSAFLVWYPALPASLCTLEMLSFAGNVRSTAVSPVSITAEEDFSANWSGWLDLSLTLALQRRPSYGPSSACGVDQICESTWFWSLTCFITYFILAMNISLNLSKHVDTFMGSGYLNSKYLEERVRSRQSSLRRFCHCRWKENVQSF